LFAWCVAAVAAFGVAAEIWVGASPAVAKQHRPWCAAPAGWSRVAHDSQVVVIMGWIALPDVDGGGHRGPEDQWRYCLRGRGHFRTLAPNAGEPGGYSDIVGLDDLRLAGTFAAYGRLDVEGGGRYGTTLAANATDLVTGRDPKATVYGLGFAKLLLAPRSRAEQRRPRGQSV
jgi:hypothetical protein